MTHSLRYEVTEINAALEKAKAMLGQYRVPVVVEIILERVTNVSMGGVDIAHVVEFEDLAEQGEDAPTAITLLD